MNITELINQYRFERNDAIEPYYMSDILLLGLFNDAEDEACRRQVLLFDATTEAVCRMDITSASSTYAKHPSIVAILSAKTVDANGNVLYLDNISRDEIDRTYPDWRRKDTGDPSYLIVDEKTVQIYPSPTGNYTLHLEVQRTPLLKMTLPSGVPEIATGHHRFLALWVHHRVFLSPDPDYGGPELAADYERQFSAYFGPRRTAKQGIQFRQDMPRRNNVTL